MSSNQPKALREEKVINGLFREALFFSRDIQVLISAEWITLNIIIIDEVSAHAKNIDRKLIMQCDPNKTKLLKSFIGTTVKAKCSFSKYVANWYGEIKSLSNNKFEMIIPKEILIFNARRESRYNTPTEIRVSGHVLLESKGLHTEALFSIEDHSSNGFGGTLIAFPEFPICIGARIIGKVRTTNGEIRINGEIVQFAILEPDTHLSKYCIYRIGIRQVNPTNKIKSSSNNIQSERKNIIHSFPLSVYSPLNPNLKVDVKVNTIALNGFSATINVPQNLSILPAGVIVSIKDTFLTAELYEIKNLELKFRLMDGPLDERIKWLKLVSTQHFKTITTDIINSSEIIDLFCQSGSLSPTFIANHIKSPRTFAEKFLTLDGEASWIHRWVERSNRGEISGNISAIQYGNNFWYLGDIASMMSKKRKVSKRYIPSFLTSFSDFCLSASPCPKLFIFWQKDHPYWNKWAVWLEKNRDSASYSKFSAHYHRFYNVYKKSNLWNVKNDIHPSEHDLIKSCLERIKLNAAKELLECLDFNPMTFGSPALKQSLSISKFQFHRKYLLLKSKNIEVLVVLQDYPEGTSPNYNMNIPWVIPLDSKPIDSILTTSLTYKINSICNEMGIKSPGILILSDCTSNSISTKSFDCYIGHPNFLQYFRGTF